jgi:integrin alpha FG-GAP repeat containing protein 1
LLIPHSHFDSIDAPFSEPQCRIANPHSNAAVDLNGDCISGSSPRLWICDFRNEHTVVDIFLVCDDGHGQKSFQIWVSDPNTGFTLAQSGQLPLGTQSVVFADMGIIL